MAVIEAKDLARLEGLEIKARMIVEGFLSGAHRSPYQGFSVEFAEHREYTPGDDLRYLDWKVYGKSDKYFIKQYEDETNFACYVVLDVSESMSYRHETSPVSKLDYARHLAAALAYLVLRQHDAAGLITFSEGIDPWLTASGKGSQWQQIVHRLENLKVTAPRAENAGVPVTERSPVIGPLLSEMAAQLTRRSVVIVISDFFDGVSGLETGMKHLRYRRHDVRLVQVIDRAEQEFPFDEPTLFHGLELTGDQLTEPRALREAYQREFAEFLSAVQHAARDLSIDYVLARTDEPPQGVLSRLLLSGGYQVT